MMRSVWVLEVREEAEWARLDSLVSLQDFAVRDLSPTRRVVKAPFYEELHHLASKGIEVLVRPATRDAATIEAEREEWADRVSALPAHVLKVLHEAQRHALAGVVLGMNSWDPEEDAGAIRHLHGQSMLMTLGPHAVDYGGLYRLPEDLPPPPSIAYDFEEAVMEETEDLSEARLGPLSLLHDLASLAAALHRVTPKRTHAGTLNKADSRKLGRQLGDEAMTSTGNFEAQPRWKRALGALEALGAVSLDPLKRELFLDLGLEDTLAGEAPEAVDRLLHRLLDRDLHVVIPAIRAALFQAGEGAIDEVVFLDELRLQHRTVVFPHWHRHGTEVYPCLPGEHLRPFDEDGWDRVECKMIEAVLRRLETMGVIRRAPGVFAATADGRVWAGVASQGAPPIWLTSDLEIIVPPYSVTPWERFQLERLGPCLRRDVVDRYKFERSALVQWLETHEVRQITELLERRAQGVPLTVLETLDGWAHDATRVILWRGVIVED